jgi:carbon storage regulator
MLILTRNIDQTIVIGPDVTVTVLGVKGQQVRLGIEAPRDTAVDRQEVRERKDAGIPLKRAADAVRHE